MKREVAVGENGIHRHFSEIASKYRDLRITDSEPILYIKRKLDGKSKIGIADVGCGDGRYSLKLWDCFGDKCYLHCIDANENMLTHLENYLEDKNVQNFRIIKTDAEKLPLGNHSMDCIVTFNAIHHFDISKFLQEAYRSLKNNGHLFIYTRFRNQNTRSIWGKYFPLFAEIENRLYELDELKRHFQEAKLKILSMKIFGYHRFSSLEGLVQKAQNYHYSTFRLYSKGTFDESLETFQKNIKDEFSDPDNISWQDENILLEIGK